jgi:ABC-type branched-subunit amino acid transport system substrate-binding protein
MKRLYPSLRACAIILLPLLVLLTACTPKHNIHTDHTALEQYGSNTHLVSPPQNSKQIMALLELAHSGGNVELALAELTRLSQESPSPLKEEAAFRRVQLLLENQYPTAIDETYKLLQAQPNYALAAYAHYWLAKWWDAKAITLDGMPTDEYNTQIFHELTAALHHPHLTQQLAKDVLAMGQSKDLNTLDEHSKIDWLLAAAHIDTMQADDFLRTAAANISLEYLQKLHQEHIISPIQDRVLYLHYARLQLMEGNINTLQAIFDMLSTDAPQLAITRTIKSWLSGNAQDVYIGVLLPLTGKYARFGQETLNGIRMATSASNQSNIHLLIEDTGKGEDAAIEGYKNLTQHDVGWVIGPLLSRHTEALLPYLKSNIPVISLSKNNTLAQASAALFIHNVAKNTQAAFMARYGFEQGIRRMAVISGSHKSQINEAQAFDIAFTDLGGEVVDHVVLDNQGIDYRNKLRELRKHSDDEMLLEELITDLVLFSPETQLEIHIPPGIDGLYLATNGKQVSELSGQLAYVDIRNIPTLGSNRWMDGHLLDDRGRNLSSGRFIHHIVAQQNSALLSQYREVWGQGKLGKLFTTAYDTTRIITLLGSRLGLHGRDAIEALHDPDGFPGESGHVQFDASGVGHKTFPIFRIQHNHLAPAGV